MTQKQIELRARALSEAHDGALLLNFGQVAKVLQSDRHAVPHILHDSGILVKKIGRQKFVDVFDLAEWLGRGRVAPIDNRPRSP
jgi:hypothetical protein